MIFSCSRSFASAPTTPRRSTLDGLHASRGVPPTPRTWARGDARRFDARAARSDLAVQRPHIVLLARQGCQLAAEADTPPARADRRHAERHRPRSARRPQGGPADRRLGLPARPGACSVRLRLEPASMLSRRDRAATATRSHPRWRTARRAVAGGETDRLNAQRRSARARTRERPGCRPVSREGRAHSGVPLRPRNLTPTVPQGRTIFDVFGVLRRALTRACERPVVAALSAAPRAST